GPASSASRRSKSASRAPVPDANPPSRLCSRPGSTSRPSRTSPPCPTTAADHPRSDAFEIQLMVSSSSFIEAMGDKPLPINNEPLTNENMARHLESVCQLCRREGIKLYLKGSRCDSPKCAIERRDTPPGMHNRRGK